jgi:hypothetical protein
MATRKEVKAILDKYGIVCNFSMRTIGFSDLARCDVQEVVLKDEMMPVPEEVYSQVKAELKNRHLICKRSSCSIYASWC